jgi:ectoine hydroxylase-related dioxygenase (phytanoyl-CoA dioxygenase family)
VILDRIHRDGFSIEEKVLSPGEVHAIQEAIEQAGLVNPQRTAGGVRNLLDIPEVAELAQSPAIRNLVDPILGQPAFAVRGTLFDKTPEANWKVPWHQDLSIAVQEKLDLDGFGPWSVKAGVVHAQPPVAILEGMLAVRIHIDDCHEENGPLRVIPGSHRLDRLTADQIQTITSQTAVASCPVDAGGVLLMRPLLLHASSASRSPAHRRVIHIDFACAALPGGLKWLSRDAL